MAVFLPFTLYIDFTSAILFLTAIFTGGGFGAAVPAILVNVPGTPSAVATTFDGYPMARSGKHNEALGLALAASTFGVAISYIVLLLLIEPISKFVLRLGPPELFFIAVWGLFLIAALTRGAFLKGVISGLVGLLIGTVGMTATGAVRGTMGSMYLLDGFPATPVVIGLFAASELFLLVKSEYIIADEKLRKVHLGEIMQGVVPGIGSAIGNLVSYAFQRSRDPEKESYGKGNPRGVLAAESANSSSEGGSMVTLLALGLPGGGNTAVMLGAFAMHNVVPGPRFMADHKDVVYSIVLGNFAQAILLVLIGLPFLRMTISVIKVPLRMLLPVILILTTLGAYALVGNMMGPITLAGAAIFGAILKRYGYSIVAMVIGVLLGSMMEGELLRSWQMGGRDLMILFERPISLTLFLATIATTFWALGSKPLIRAIRARRYKGNPDNGSAHASNDV
jgi:putative tricarboxylic transport membrane protein